MKSWYELKRTHRIIEVWFSVEFGDSIQRIYLGDVDTIEAANQQIKLFKTAALTQQINE